MDLNTADQEYDTKTGEGDGEEGGEGDGEIEIGGKEGEKGGEGRECDG